MSDSLASNLIQKKHVDALEVSEHHRRTGRRSGAAPCAARARGEGHGSAHGAGPAGAGSAARVPWTPGGSAYWPRAPAVAAVALPQVAAAAALPAAFDMLPGGATTGTKVGWWQLPAWDCDAALGAGRAPHSGVPTPLDCARRTAARRVRSMPTEPQISPYTAA